MNFEDTFQVLFDVEEVFMSKETRPQHYLLEKKSIKLLWQRSNL